MWGALAHLTGFINLFNLVPFWQLDGSRGFHALSRWQRWTVVGALAAAYFATGLGLLLLIGAVAIYRALEKAVPKGDNEALATFLILIVALSWMSAIQIAIP
jgi:Zn-dependent protease